MNSSPAMVNPVDQVKLSGYLCEALAASTHRREIKFDVHAFIGPAIQVLACVALLVSYLLHTCPDRVGVLLDCIFLGLVCSINWALYSSEAEFELAEKRHKMLALIDVVKSLSPLSADALRKTRVAESELPTMAYVLRAGRVWVPVPYNLLVEGDLIALKNGASAPAQIRSIPLNKLDEPVEVKYTESASSNKNATPPENKQNDSNTTTFVGGEIVVVPSSPQWALDDARIAALHLCGNVGAFRVLETPVLSNVRTFLDKKELLRNQQHTALAMTVSLVDDIARLLCVGCSLFALALAVVRLLVRSDGYGTTVLILEMPVIVWATLTPLALPLWREVLEIVAVAQLLDEIDQRQNITNMTLSSSVDREDREEEQQSRAYHVSLWGFIRQFLRTFKRRLLFRYSLSSSSRQFGCCPRRQAPAPTDIEMGSRALYSRTLAQSTAAIEAVSDPLLCALPLVTLGSLTSLCCVDDKIILSPVPCVQEVYLLKGQQSSIVMDVSHDPAARFGVRFEDPKWTKHFGSLKPIGLISTLACTLPVRELSSLAQPGPTPNTSSKEAPAVLRHDTVGTPGGATTSVAGIDVEANIRITVTPTTTVQQQQQQHLSSALDELSLSFVKRGTPDHLRNLANEIGFRVQDVSQYTLCQVVLLYDRTAVAPNTPGMFYGHHHGRAQAVVLVVEDMSRRSTQPPVRRSKHHRRLRLQGSTPTDDERSLHMLSLGFPGILIPRAAEYWDGESIWPLHLEDRNAIMGLHEQWSKEDFDAVAFSYTPVPTALNALFPRPIAVPDVHSGTPRGEDNGVGESGALSFNPNPSPCIQLVVSRPQPQPQSKDVKITDKLSLATGHHQQHQAHPEEHKQEPIKQNKKHVNGVDLHFGKESGVKDVPSVGSGITIHEPHISQEAEAGDKTLDLKTKLDRIGDLLERQIFVGMVGSQEQPNSSMTLLIEDLRAAGVRFVHFSTREPRRARVVADKMGLETDWNTSISLKELSTETPLDGRFEWDINARLPHGIEEIKRHLAEVDEVPLLVSTFTDSSPHTSRAMMQIMQENNEIVAAVGNGLNMANFESFLNADVSISMLPHILTSSSPIHANSASAAVVPAEREVIVSVDRAPRQQLSGQSASSPASAGHSGVYSESDMAGISDYSEGSGNNGGREEAAFHNMLILSSAFNSLPCAIVLRETTDPYILADILREARRLHTNLRQGLMLIYGAKATLAILLCLSLLISVPIVLTTSDVVWLLTIQLPMLALAMLFNAGEKLIMTRMPPKREPMSSARALMRSRFGTHLFALAGITAMEVLLVHTWTYATYLDDRSVDPRVWWQAEDDGFNLNFGHCSNTQAAVAATVARIAALVACVLDAIVASVALMNRTESVLRERLWSAAWFIAVVGVVVLQLVYSEVVAHVSGYASHLGGFAWVTHIPYTVWLLLLLWPVVFLGVTEAFKVKDRRIFNRHMQRLRLIFDTRLGMYSPK